MSRSRLYEIRVSPTPRCELKWHPIERVYRDKSDVLLPRGRYGTEPQYHDDLIWTRIVKVEQEDVLLLLGGDTLWT